MWLNSSYAQNVNSGEGVGAVSLLFSPRCVVVIGNTSEFQADGVEPGAFENFRTCLNGVTVLAYDELLGRMGDLLGILVVDGRPDSSDVTGA